MKAIIVDDMPKAVRLLTRILEKLEGVEVIQTFTDSLAVVEYMADNVVDLVFMDVEMPGLDGLELTSDIQKMQKIPEVVFVTGHPQYSLEAWKTDALAYLVKPYTNQDIQKVIDKYRKIHPEKKAAAHIKIHCFPSFGLFVDGKGVVIRSKKAREVLAYLVHSRGEWVENSKMAYILLGDEIDEESARNNFRMYLYRLNQALQAAGISELVERAYGKTRVDTSKFVCDYYRYLDGEYQLFHGDYLQDYSWSEPAVASMLQEK